MNYDWPISPILMVLSFPALCVALLLYVCCIAQFSPRVLRAHHVMYRPIRVCIAEGLLILRFASALLSKRQEIPRPAARLSPSTPGVVREAGYP